MCKDVIKSHMHSYVQFEALHCLVFNLSDYIYRHVCSIIIVYKQTLLFFHMYNYVFPCYFISERISLQVKWLTQSLRYSMHMYYNVFVVFLLIGISKTIHLNILYSL